MSFVRIASRRALASTPITPVSRRTFAFTRTQLAQNGYGDPKGDPAGADPQAQGKNPKVDQEHPGPPPPSAAGGPGGSSSASKSSSSGSSKSASSGSSKSSSSKSKSRPAIQDQSQPKNESEDVKRHNEEFENRGSKKNEQGSGNEEKVDPKFWKGHAGESEK